MTTPAVLPTEPNGGPSRETLPPPDTFETLLADTGPSVRTGEVQKQPRVSIRDVRAMRARGSSSLPPAEQLAASRARVHTMLDTERAGRREPQRDAPDDWPDDIHADWDLTLSILRRLRDEPSVDPDAAG